jgi:hypothetical protein
VPLVGDLVGPRGGYSPLKLLHGAAHHPLPPGEGASLQPTPNHCSQQPGVPHSLTTILKVAERKGRGRLWIASRALLASQPILRFQFHSWASSRHVDEPRSSRCDANTDHTGMVGKSMGRLAASLSLSRSSMPIEMRIALSIPHCTGLCPVW